MTETHRPDRPVRLFADVVRVTAGNPGVMTGPGTNTYLLGTGDLAVVDPGPDDLHHLDAVATAGGGRIRWILVTHTHPDHAPGASRLASWTGAEQLGFDARDGFAPDRRLADGCTVRAPGLSLRAVHTPGHASNHLCYLLDGVAGRLLCTGDHVMQGSTVVISPPDGDMADYLASLRLVAALDPPVDVIAPGHGSLIENPIAAIGEVVDHRLARQTKVAATLQAAGSSTVDGLLTAVYDDVDTDRLPIARRSLWAHLRKLAVDRVVATDDPDDIGATYRWGPA
jgi:glyoxylase-like metal-dependent hydrolase (beta-lactamase superfamily II)